MLLDNKVLNMRNYEASKYNAFKHGILSKYTVLHWENRNNYNKLVDSLLEEYKPNGVSEEHLVEELAGIIWRKMRLRNAETASNYINLNKCIKNEDYSKDSAAEALITYAHQVANVDLRKAVLNTQEDNQKELVIISEYFNCCIISEKIILETESYEKGLAALHNIDQDKWNSMWLDEDDEEMIVGEDDEEIIAEEEEDENFDIIEEFLSFLNTRKAYYEELIYEIQNREEIKTQILGKSFLSDNDINKYIRYENHLDKKFEKTLAMLLKLQDLKRTNTL